MLGRAPNYVLSLLSGHSDLNFGCTQGIIEFEFRRNLSFFNQHQMYRVFHQDGTLPHNGEVFVFGSNLAGRHGAGAAKVACARFGAPYGRGEGFFGQSYAIPTKGLKLEILDIEKISAAILRFIEFACENSQLRFFVTRVGCGLAGYSDQQIAPLFSRASHNCSFPHTWRVHLN